METYFGATDASVKFPNLKERATLRQRTGFAGDRSHPDRARSKHIAEALRLERAAVEDRLLTQGKDTFIWVYYSDGLGANDPPADVDPG